MLIHSYDPVYLTDPSLMNGFNLSSENLLLVLFKESELSRTQVLQKVLKETDPDKVKILHDNTVVTI